MLKVKMTKMLGGMAILCLPAVSADAQQTLSSINGTITDASGASVGGATVTIKEDGTSFTRIAKTAKDGYFQMLNLPVGTYTVTVTKDGFDTDVIPNIAVVESRA